MKGFETSKRASENDGDEQLGRTLPSLAFPSVLVVLWSHGNIVAALTCSVDLPGARLEICLAGSVHSLC